jgi:DNA-binding beta-propeller fold protein YncE
MRERSVDRSGSRRRLMRVVQSEVASLFLAGLVLLLVTAGALAAPGDLTQPAGIAGCVSEDGSGPCADGHALFSAGSVAVSADGKSVYAASFGSQAVDRLNRNTTNGAISQPAGVAGCVSDDGTGPCADGHAILGPAAVAVSPDGKSVYAASYSGYSVVRFNRNKATGAIAEPAGTGGCVTELLGGCLPGHALDHPIGVAVSPDGKNVYVASQSSNAVVRLNRNTTTGAITQPAGAAGCVSDDGSGPCADGHALSNPRSVAVSPDGKSVYAVSPASHAVVRLNRNATTGAITQPAGAAGCVSDDASGPCADGHSLFSPESVSVSPDGKSVYVASVFDQAVVRLNRSKTTGAIVEPSGTGGCISGGVGLCAPGHGFSGMFSVAVSPDGRSVYAASQGANTVVRLNRNRTTGAITQPAGTAGCISEDGSGPCVNGHGLMGPESVAVSPSGTNVYVASSNSNAVARLHRNP